ncbi:MAG: hypothetical protein LUC34_02900 [Campylobacter sp.]|nr:hypothetical protein [Campylobacter sp.]
MSKFIIYAFDKLFCKFKKAKMRVPSKPFNFVCKRCGLKVIVRYSDVMIPIDKKDLPICFFTWVFGLKIYSRLNLK